MIHAQKAVMGVARDGAPPWLPHARPPRQLATSRRVSSASLGFQHPLKLAIRCLRKEEDRSTVIMREAMA